MKRFIYIIIAAGMIFVSCNHNKKTPGNNPQSIFTSQFSISQNKASDSEAQSEPQPNWKDVPALKDAYKDYFDYFGFAIPESQLKDKSVISGASYQASCFTCENECKPDFIFNWARPAKLVDFTAENGKNYAVPETLWGFTRLSEILTIARDNNMKMRGHVLVWHNQTPAWFFREDYNPDNAMVNKTTMNARLEWYIKSVLEFVKNWEEQNNDGKRIIITWDVVNEACTDGQWTDNPMRTESPWFKIYGDDTFIVNAFRYANRYAPADVKLAYNDYSCYAPNKTKAICRVVQDIQAAADARIDVVGMQSHVSMTYPSVSGYENAVKEFLALGVDVQVTEMEIAFGGRVTTQEELANRYAEYFTMFLNNRKLPGKNGISGITLWGTRDEVSWIRNNKDNMNKVQRPLLFEKDYECKPAFFKVLEVAQEFGE